MVKLRPYQLHRLFVNIVVVVVVAWRSFCWYFISSVFTIFSFIYIYLVCFRRRLVHITFLVLVISTKRNVSIYPNPSTKNTVFIVGRITYIRWYIRSFFILFVYLFVRVFVVFVSSCFFVVVIVGLALNFFILWKRPFSACFIAL